MFHITVTSLSILAIMFYNSVCRLHVSLHGCLQAKEILGDIFAAKTGYNEVAAINNIIVLYPQVKHNVFVNPRGCFDW